MGDAVRQPPSTPTWMAQSPPSVKSSRGFTQQQSTPQGIGQQQPSAHGAPALESVAPTKRAPLCACLSVDYYKQYFDVDTIDVFKRWIASLTFCRKTSFIEMMGETADAYGPFWNATTLIFIVAVTTNLGSWVSFQGEGNWTYDFTKVVTCASIIYGFLFAGTVLIWLMFSQIGSKLTLIQCFCLYGYGMSVYLPVGVVCAIPVNGIAWFALFMAMLWSGLFLLRTLVPIAMEHNQKWTIVVMAFGAVSQFVFALLLKILFYTY